MYSVVLLMALTSGGDAPALGGRGGCCGGYGGCYGCSGGCHGGGHGCRGGHHRSHGCCGGYSGCYGCYGGNFGCSGGCYGSGHGCRGGHHRSHGCCGCCGGSYGGNYGCYGGNFGGLGCVGGVGGVIVPPVAPTTTPKKTSLENSAPATLIVSVPADARLSIDGEATTSMTTQRVFVSPALNFGREYHYTLQAEFVKDGKKVTLSKEVAVQAGEETRVSFSAADSAEMASR